jgi:hypothetical protein
MSAATVDGSCKESQRRLALRATWGRVAPSSGRGLVARARDECASSAVVLTESVNFTP